MTLKQNEICKFSTNCKYNINNACQGCNKSRNTSFECKFIDGEGKQIEEGYARSVYDLTGKMEFIQE